MADLQVKPRNKNKTTTGNATPILKRLIGTEVGGQCIITTKE